MLDTIRCIKRWIYAVPMEDGKYLLRNTGSILPWLGQRENDLVWV